MYLQQCCVNKQRNWILSLFLVQLQYLTVNTETWCSILKSWTLKMILTFFCQIQRQQTNILLQLSIVFFNRRIQLVTHICFFLFLLSAKRQSGIYSLMSPEFNSLLQFFSGPCCIHSVCIRDMFSNLTNQSAAVMNPLCYLSPSFSVVASQVVEQVSC